MEPKTPAPHQKSGQLISHAEEQKERVNVELRSNEIKIKWSVLQLANTTETTSQRPQSRPVRVGPGEQDGAAWRPVSATQKMVSRIVA